MMTVRSFAEKTAMPSMWIRNCRHVGISTLLPGYPEGFAVSAARPAVQLSTIPPVVKHWDGIADRLPVDRNWCCFFLTGFLGHIPLATLGVVLVTPPVDVQHSSDFLFP